jgi:hypothetical protein
MKHENVIFIQDVSDCMDWDKLLNIVPVGAAILGLDNYHTLGANGEIRITVIEEDLQEVTQPLPHAIPPSINLTVRHLFFRREEYRGLQGEPVKLWRRVK